MHPIPYDYEAAFNKNLEDLHELFVKQMLNNRYKYIYALKEISSGEQFEVEIYPEFTKISDVPKEGRIKRDNSIAQKNLNDKNAQKYVERLINENFGDSDLWITLTYGPGQEPQTWDEAIKNMQNYIDRINYRRKKRKLPIARYVYITEYAPEEEIRWHHHLVMDGMLDMDTVEAAWKKSSRNEVRRIKKDEHGLSGMAIYITKDKHREKGERRWNCSKSLRKPRIRKVHSKRPTATAGAYKPIGKYVDGFVRDHNSIKEQMLKWYPDCDFTDSGVYYNDFNGMFYIKARMRRKVCGNENETHKTRNHSGRNAVRGGRAAGTNRRNDNGNNNRNDGKNNGSRHSRAKPAETGDHKTDKGSQNTG